MDWPFVTTLISALITDRNYLDLMPQVNEQISLFDTDIPKAPDSKPSSFGQKNIPQEVVDEFLRLGGCMRNSAQRIYGFYRRAKDQAENIAFLKSEYERDSVGLVVGDRQYAVKWNEEGVRFSTGTRVSEVSSVYMIGWSFMKKRRSSRELTNNTRMLSIKG